MPDHKRVDAQHPWPWLDPFTEDATGLFGGRDDDAQGLLRSVLATPVCVLFGKSGLGKTSLLLAGLFPLLRRRALLPVAVRRVEHGEGGAGVSAQLLRALDDRAAEAGLSWALPLGDESASGAVAALFERLHDRNQQLLDTSGRRWAPVFVLDQFEEIFTLQADDGRRRRAFEELGDLLENRVPPVVAERIDRDEALLDRIDLDSQPYRFLISLREDFLPELEYWADMIPRLGPNRYRLLPMSHAQALEAVQKTGGALVTSAAATRIVQFLGRQTPQGGGAREERRIEPALLSLVCASLNADRLAQDPPGAQLDVSNLEARGAQILDRFYDAAFADLAPSLRTVAERWVEGNLITDRGARRPYPFEAVEPALAPALRHLVDHRLLRIETTEQGEQIELVHDRLAAIALQRAQVVQRRAEEAERLRQAKEAAEMEVLKQRARTAEIAEQRARLEEARAADAVTASRRARRLTAGLAVVTLLAVGAAVSAGFQYLQAETAREDAEAARDEAVKARDQADEARRLALADADAARLAHDAKEQALKAANEALEAARAAVASTGGTSQAAAGLLSEANRSYRAAATVSEQLEECPAGRRVYPHFLRDTDDKSVEPFVKALENSGFIVARGQRMDAKDLPPNTVVRYFRTSEAAGANEAAAVLRKAGLMGVVPQMLPGYENSTRIRPCHYELWVAAGSRKSG